MLPTRRARARSLDDRGLRVPRAAARPQRPRPTISPASDSSPSPPRLVALNLFPQPQLPPHSPHTNPRPCPHPHSHPPMFILILTLLTRIAALSSSASLPSFARPHPLSHRPDPSPSSASSSFPSTKTPRACSGPSALPQHTPPVHLLLSIRLPVVVDALAPKRGAASRHPQASVIEVRGRAWAGRPPRYK